MSSTAAPLAAVGSLSLLLSAAVLPVSAHASPSAQPSGPTDPPGTVQSATYTLGDDALEIPGYDAPVELTGIVHYPTTPGEHPVVVLSHGMWWTCTDDDSTWPCLEGAEPIESYRGYDELAEGLAGEGFVVVSVSANGVNGGPMGQAADHARAAIVMEHLQQFQQIADDGEGPLSDVFTDPETGETKDVDLVGAMDFENVGVLGHSRGGRAAAWQAASKNRASWPDGISIRAVTLLGAVGYYAPDPEAPEHDDYRITDVPFLTMTGTCDYASRDASAYIENSRGRTDQPIHSVTFTGSNHNYYNTQWSPDSGVAHAENDAPTDDAHPGKCTSPFGTGSEWVTQLSEPDQRWVSGQYISAFFRAYLMDDPSGRAILEGTTPVRPDITSLETILPR